MKPKKYDFAGYVTKFNVRCTDGRVIREGAFSHQDGKTVPLVWQHGSGDPGNILGFVTLESRPDGVYGYCSLNGSGNANNVGGLVEHSAINSLSIHASRLKQIGADVIDGLINEVSTVLSGANPGAKIDSMAFSHGDFEEDPADIDEAIIYSGDTELMHSEDGGNADSTTPVEPEVTHAAATAAPAAAAAATDGEETVGDVLATLNSKQQAAVGYLIDEIEKGNSGDTSAQHSDEENEDMKRNVFDDASESTTQTDVLTHEDFVAVMEMAPRFGSFHKAFIQHMKDSGYELTHADDSGAGISYGIADLDILFPDARAINNTPDFIKRNTDWVNNVMGGTKHSPFSRIKSIQADITEDEARAKGYIKGTQKMEEVFSLLSRTTTPKTVYKKQKLDRDDVLDITDFDVIVWLKQEMRLMLDEEIARAILISDGRSSVNPDKINEENLRPIYKDDALYAIRADVTSEKMGDKIDDVVRACQDYQGSGTPSFYASRAVLTDMLLVKDSLGRRLYPTRAELAAALGVKEVVEVEVMTGVAHPTTSKPLFGIVVNLTDYTVGADKGGEVTTFDDFDIDFNQQKYLIETRISGALTKPKSAIILELPVPEQG